MFACCMIHNILLHQDELYTFDWEIDVVWEDLNPCDLEANHTPEEDANPAISQVTNYK